MTRLVWLGVAVTAVFTVSQVHAIPLGTLIDTNGTIQVGDKHFANFELHDVTGQNSTPADPRNLQIDGFTNLLGEPGLRLSPFSVSIPNADSSGALVFSLEYDVTVTDPSFLLHDVRHAFSTTSNRGGGLSLITQAGFPPDVNASMQAVVGFGGTGQLLIDHVNESENFVNQVSSQHMLHNFEAHALTVNLTSQGGPVVLGTISTSPIELTFSQTVIPEPATGLLLASGLVGLMGLRSVCRRESEEARGAERTATAVPARTARPCETAADNHFSNGAHRSFRIYPPSRTVTDLVMQQPLASTPVTSIESSFQTVYLLFAVTAGSPGSSERQSRLSGSFKRGTKRTRPRSVPT